MKKLATALSLALLGLCVTSSSAAAQFVYVAGGPSFPMSDYGDYADAGFLLAGGVGIPLGENGLSAFGEGFYGQNNHTDASGGGKTNPWGLMGGVQYEFDLGGSLTPYVFGEAGIMWHKYTPDTGDGDSQSAFGYGGGVGVAFPLGGLMGAVEGRLMNAAFDEAGTSYNTMFGGILAGIGIPIGG